MPCCIFKDGGVTEAASFLETLGTAPGTELNTLHADATGDLGVYGMKLPSPMKEWVSTWAMNIAGASGRRRL
jgi:hypothetical protein